MASFSQTVGVEFIPPNIISVGVSHCFPTYDWRKIWSFLRYDSSDLISTSVIVWVECVLEGPISLRIKPLNCSGCWAPIKLMGWHLHSKLELLHLSGFQKETHHLLLLSALHPFTFPGGLIFFHHDFYVRETVFPEAKKNPSAQSHSLSVNVCFMSGSKTLVCHCLHISTMYRIRL